MVTERGPPDASQAFVGSGFTGRRRWCGVRSSTDVHPDETRKGGERWMAREADTDRRQPRSQPHRGDATGGFIRRMMRSKLSLVPAEPVDETPLQVLSRWARDMNLDVNRQDLLELARSLRGCIHFEEDGSLMGSGIVRSLRHQAKLIAPERWGQKNTLRFLADRVEGSLRNMGLL